jgi:hypothetical protein
MILLLQGTQDSQIPEDRKHHSGYQDEEGRRRWEFLFN